MKIKPLADRVIVKQLEAENKTASGIIIPDTAKEKPQEGKVVAVGSGKIINGKKMPLDVKKNDLVLFSKYGGDEVKIEGVEYKILKEEDILAIIEK